MSRRYCETKLRTYVEPFALNIDFKATACAGAKPRSPNEPITTQEQWDDIDPFNTSADKSISTMHKYLDRKNKVAYCAISKRSDLNLFEKFCKDIGYSPIKFTSYDSNVLYCEAKGVGHSITISPTLNKVSFTE